MIKRIVIQYRRCRLVDASLELLLHQLTWPSTPPVLVGPYGPYFLSSNNAPFLPVLVRTLHRGFYHAQNGWRLLLRDLESAMQFPELEPDWVMQTSDFNSKFEIEAFLAVIKSLETTELIGQGKPVKSLLERSVQGIGEDLALKLQQRLLQFRVLAHGKKWGLLRNSTEHLGKHLTDNGFAATIKMVAGVRRVTLEHIYAIEDTECDLVKVLEEATNAFIDMVEDVRGLLTTFARSHVSMPTNETIISIFDDVGNMHVSYGPHGYLERAFTKPYVQPPDQINGDLDNPDDAIIQ